MWHVLLARCALHGATVARRGATVAQRVEAVLAAERRLHANFPEGATMELFPTNDSAFGATNAKPIAQFFTDAQAGMLPSFSLFEPDYQTQSQENPQNIAVGEAFLASMVHALAAHRRGRARY